MVMEDEIDEFADLVPKLLCSDREAEDRFFVLAYGRLMAWATRNFSIPESDREDFALEVIEKSLKRLERYKPRKAKFCTWMFAIARNHAFDRSRKLMHGKDPLQGALSEDVLE